VPSAWWSGSRWTRPPGTPRADGPAGPATAGRRALGPDRVHPHGRAGPVGPHPAGLQDRHLDAQRRHLGGQDRGEPADGPLGRLVGGQPRRRHPAADRGDLDDPPGPLRAHDRQRRLGQPDHAEQVGVHLGPEVLEVHVFDGADVGIAGVVDQDVQPAEPGYRGGHGGPGGPAVGHLQRDDGDPLAVLAGQVAERGVPPGAGHHPVARLQRGPGDLPAQPPGGPADQEHGGIGRGR